MRPDVMRLGVALAALALASVSLAGCGPTPKPFEHEPGDDVAFHPKRDKNEVIVATPANMPGKLADKIATALALELQSYDIVAAVQPAQAPLKVAGATSTRDAGFGLGIEIQIEWYLLGGGNIEGPAVSKTVARPEDIAEGNDRLVSRIAQQAAPRIATLMGKPPTIEARAPGQVAAGVNVPDTPADPANPSQTAAAAPSRPQVPTVKVMVSQVVGAPSDGNRQLFSGMRRALGSSRIVVIDKAGADTFTVGATVKLTPIDDRMTQLDISWVLTDPAGREVGKVDQSNPVPASATKGSWVGFGDIVATAAVEGILELLEKAQNRQQR
jgi:hypothetical protein